MPVNPFLHSCRVPSCGAPVASRGACALHASQQDTHRGLTSDRQHKALYDSARWRLLRRAILAARPFCECDQCRGGHVRVTPASVVHHRQPHHGDEHLFFGPDNLQALAKVCHDRITGAGSFVGATRVQRPRLRVARETLSSEKGV